MPESDGRSRRPTRTGRGGRHRTLTPQAVCWSVRALRPEGLTLREIAAATAVSHETARLKLQESVASVTAD